MAQKIVNGISFGDMEEEYENIDEVGPGGTYLLTSHTLEHMKEELYVPKLFNKMGYNKWVMEGLKTENQRALEEAERRIAAYRPVEMDLEQEKVLRSYIGDLYDSI